MNKKGFTLIELLAVIVILAIIALIATPIILNIIDDAKGESELRSADFYLTSLELSIAQATLDGEKLSDGNYTIKDGNICRNTDCTETLPVEVKGKVPKSGTITIKNGQLEEVSLILNEKIIEKDTTGKLVYKDQKTKEKICELKSETAKIVGAKYECDFGDGKRNFYILELGTSPVTNSTLKEDEVALILAGNYDTTTQSWLDLNNKLDEIAEKAWTKLKRQQIGIPSAEQIATADGQNLSDSSINISNTNDWLYKWEGNDEYNAGMSPPFGYWTSTLQSFDSSYGWSMYSGNTLYNFESASDSEHFGTRPVINIKI